MMNIKAIFITSGLSVIFGVYSIYNILEYLKLMHDTHNKEIYHLNKSIKDINNKYTHLKSKYDDIKSEIQQTKEYITNLQLQIAQLQNDSNDLENSIAEIVKSETVSINTEESIICDEMCDFNSHIPRIHMETMNANKDGLDHESLNCNYDHCHHIIISKSNLDSSYHSTNSMRSAQNSDKSARSRSVSLTDINWTGVTKKFLFG